MISGHGGNIYELAHRIGCRPSDISDMSANVNPLGPMPELIDYLRANMSAIAALPEVDAGGIVKAFSRFYGIDPRHVMAGNGTTQLIYLIPRALGAKKALVVGPTYSDYRDACAMNQVPCDHLICREKDDFVPDMETIRKGAATADLVFLCNPNNPTGTLVKRPDIDALCRSLPDTVFVVDESYLPFAPMPADATMIGSDLPNVMVLNSMSKAFRIPGLRIGFVKTPEPLMQGLTPFALPWSVNSLAQAAVQWLMDRPEPVDRFLSSTRSILETEKTRIEEYIHQRTRIRCFPTATSFILMRLPDGLDAPTVWRHMADNRILIRDCSNFTGLSDAFIRISLKTEKENHRATELLVQLFRDHVKMGTIHEF
ncbi:MAG: pyridoxal phosphate-dependent class II aminotransferase [Desulfosarcina sp.]|nr:pyridoxal phosphate-dependent class II aminotransferase [Desulfosarcina sp.]MBC2744426.1 pyridoxal phosphate-dependent class II aminotransferase [Desulfosarcina sp.]MBC2767334.1 pyridoxal phosphate-dependent class II aminotransferase [Desulfosarcina sp.]